VEIALVVDEHRLAGRDVAQQAEAERVERDRLGGDHVLGAGGGLVVADHRRPDAEGIAERQHAVAGDHRHHGIGAAQAPVDVGDRGEDGARLEPELVRRLLQLVRQHVDQHLGVGPCVDVPQVGAEHLLLQLIGVGQVAVVAEDDAERRVDVERLRLGGLERRAGGRIAAMGNAEVAGEVAHVARAEHVAHHAAALVHVQGGLLAGDDARRVLAAVLQEQQPVIEELVDGRASDDSEDPAHLGDDSRVWLRANYISGVATAPEVTTA